MDFDTGWFQLCCIWGKKEKWLQRHVFDNHRCFLKEHYTSEEGVYTFTTLLILLCGLICNTCYVFILTSAAFNSFTYKLLNYSQRCSTFLPGSEGMILSLFSIWPDSMGNMSFKDFCDENKILLKWDAQLDFLLSLNKTKPTLGEFYVQMDLRGKCRFQDMSCRLPSQRGHSISPSACTPEHI